MAHIDIEEVSLAELPAGQLWGRHIDLPQAGSQSDTQALEIIGWVLGRSAPAVAVEVLHDDAVIRRVPLGVHRPDLAAAFPHVPEAAQSGFRTSISLLGTVATLELRLQAVLQDQQRVPIGGLWLRRGLEEANEASMPLVSVIIPCYNQAHFLSEAIESVLKQTYPHVEIVVVDDGSTDNTAEVADRYPGVRCIQQANQGLAGARNTGLRQSIGDYIVFLDADDRLLPQALKTGLDALNTHPECAFVSGHCRFIAADGSPLSTPQPPAVENDHYAQLLRKTYIWTPAVVMYRRALFQSMAGFDESVDSCADYELYLRITRQSPIYCHGQVIAEYRQHGANMTRNPALMLKTVLSVVRRQWQYLKGNQQSIVAYRSGIRFWQEFYGQPLVEEIRRYVQERKWRRALRGLLILLRYYPPGLTFLLGRPLPQDEQRLRQDLANHEGYPPVNEVQYGSLRRLTPISEVFGYDRGLPIDRYYIESFLARHAGDVHGRVLEIGDDAYTWRFGGSRVTTSDVLHVVVGNPKATIVADLTCADHIPSDTFDCIIFTQTLQLIYDVRAALKTLHRILKPGGVLLATVPGISRIAEDEWGDYWCWGFTSLSTRRLFEEAFAATNVRLKAHGNILAAIAFLHGLAVEELSQDELDTFDPHYTVSITLRAVKTREGNANGSH